MSESYTSRPMWLRKESTYTIEREGLRIQDSGGDARTLPWHKIAKVRLHWAQAKNQPRSYYCHLTLEGDRGEAASFSQMRFQGVLSYLDQSAQYNAFVKTLAARIADAAPQAQFVTGSGPIERAVFAGVVWLAAVGCGFVSIMIITGAWGRVETGTSLAFAAASAGLAWLGWKVYEWNAPKPIDPRALPPEVLAIPIR